MLVFSGIFEMLSVVYINFTGYTYYQKFLRACTSAWLNFARDEIFLILGM